MKTLVRIMTLSVLAGITLAAKNQDLSETIRVERREWLKTQTREKASPEDVLPDDDAPRRSQEWKRKTPETPEGKKREELKRKDKSFQVVGSYGNFDAFRFDLAAAGESPAFNYFLSYDRYSAGNVFWDGRRVANSDRGDDRFAADLIFKLPADGARTAAEIRCGGRYVQNTLGLYDRVRYGRIKNNRYRLYSGLRLPFSDIGEFSLTADSRYGVQFLDGGTRAARKMQYVDTGIRTSLEYVWSGEVKNKLRINGTFFGTFLNEAGGGWRKPLSGEFTVYDEFALFALPLNILLEGGLTAHTGDSVFPVLMAGVEWSITRGLRFIVTGFEYRPRLYRLGELVLDRPYVAYDGYPEQDRHWRSGAELSWDIVSGLTGHIGGDYVSYSHRLFTVAGDNGLIVWRGAYIDYVEAAASLTYEWAEVFAASLSFTWRSPGLSSGALRRVPYIGGEVLDFSLNWSPPGWFELAAEADLYADVYADTAGQERLPLRYMVNLELSRRFARGLSLFLAGKNLANCRYVYFEGFTARGISVHAGAKLEL